MATPLNSPDRSRDDRLDDRRVDVHEVRDEVREVRDEVRDNRFGGVPEASRDDPPVSPVGRPFPSVGGTALSGENVRFPGDLAGGPAVLLIAYQRMAHSDVSSWREFLESRQPGLTVYEVPTIPAIAFRSWASWIDSCMRKGIPEALWPRIVTLYADGAPVRDLLGHSDLVRAAAVLLDAGGVVRWAGFGGFTPDKGGDLLDELRSLEDQPPA